MLIKRALMVSLVLTAVAVILAACPAQPTPDVNAAVQTALAQTRIAEESVSQAVAATLTASAPTGTTGQTQATDTVPPAADTPAPTADAPTSTPIPAPPTDTPAPAPTATPIRIAISPVDGDDGNDFLRGSNDSNNGRNILLPGFDQEDVGDEPTFRDFINFRVEVFDTRAGLYDGAGIQEVTFRIIADDGTGDTVWEKTEENAPYCVFGGDAPDCAPAVDLRPGAQWPNPFAGRINNNVYLAEIDITPDNGEATQWRWRFFIDSPELETEGAPNTARINQIWVADGRYFVDFDTFGFTPQLPGQHVHFFWNTVPQQQAGVPGSGPWQLYPAQAGGTNTSPFTMFTVSERPPLATAICILVANNDHSVNQGTGNCVDVP
ncbi:MAG: hypothetical protein R2844_05815 [Caldilineales bacterium]